MSAPSEYVGYSGTGTFTQSGGANNIGYYGYYGYYGYGHYRYYVSGPLYLGNNAGGSGAYNLSGSGQLSASSVYVGYSGTGTFTQSGGTNSTSGLYLGNNAGGSGAYSLGGSGLLSASSEYVGLSGTGTFTQTGGTNSVSSLYLGNNAGGSGAYSLGGSGLLSAASEYVGYDPRTTALFQQTGGTNTVSNLSIGSGGTYLLGGGALQVAGNLVNQGIFAGNGSPATLSSNNILDLSSGTWQNLGALSLSMGPNSLLILPAGFDASTDFAHYSSLGLTHTLGTTLTVPAAQGFVGSVSISDPVDCQGTIAAAGGAINLSGGLTLSGTGAIDLGSGNLTTNDLLSVISGGSLYLANHYVGNGGTGAFTQSGGTNSIGNALYLGNNAGDSGAYSLGGSGQLSASSESVGLSGTATFTQSGGTHSIANSLYLGNNAGGSGAYSLGGSGLLSASSEYVGLSGTGTFTQTGGTNSVSSLYLGNNAGSSGTYNLGGSGLLSASSEYVGLSGTGTFTQTGGTNTVSNLSISPGGTYLLEGGALQVTGSLLNQGIFAGNGTPATLSSNNILDLSSGTWRNLGALSLSMGPNSLLILPAGFDASTDFAHYSSLGLTHTLGTTLTVPAAQGFVGSVSISDPVDCQGTIAAAGGAINLSGGLTLSGTGAIDLGSGNLTTNDLLSVISGGSLYLANHYVGNGGTGAFTQSGGTNSIGNALYLGNNAGDSGAYSLGGSGQLSASSESVGLSGTATFTQSGGTNNIGYYNYYGYSSGSLCLGNNAGGSGAYNLGGSGQLSAPSEYVGYSGTGTFTQSGGTNNIGYYASGSLCLGANAGSTGVYNLGSSGQLSAPFEYVGYSGTGTFTQSGGTNNIGYGSLNLGNNAGSSGTYNLSGSGQLSASDSEYVGLSGTGTFTQSGGINSASGLYLGFNAGSSGAYSLGGSGQLSVSSEYVGYSGTGTFTQSGGTHSIANSLYLGYYGGSSGAYSLGGSGLLSAASFEYVGLSGTGSFTQSGGTHSIVNSLYLGFNAGGCGAYNLSGSGLLSAASEYVGYDPGATALFRQTGGINATSFISIGSGGRYLLNSGTLDVTGNGGISNQGIIDFTNSDATLVIGSSCIVDLSHATLTNVTAMTVSMGPNSLLIVPVGFDPSTAFAHYSSLGLTHTLGATLAVPAGQGFGGLGAITDLVSCQGTITAAAGGAINLSGGLTLSGTGTINLGNGNLTTNDLLSGISGGSLYVANHYVGNGGTGTFTQSGGNNTISNALYLGNNAGDSGAYNLGGSGLLSASSEYVGFSGTGSFTQSGGTHNIANFLYLGFNAGSSGAFSLSDSGQLSASSVYVGYSGTGTFMQSGGTHSIANSLHLGFNAGGSGAYSLGGSGLLSAASEYVGYDPRTTALFQQTGGTNTVSNLSIGSGGTYLLGGRHLAGRRQSLEPGNLRRQRLAGDAQQQQHLGSLQRHMAEPGSPLAQHGPQFALDPARRIRRLDGLRSLQQLGVDPHPRHNAHGPRRAGLCRFSLDQRSGRLPRLDCGPCRRRHQSQWGIDALRYRHGQFG